MEKCLSAVLRQSMFISLLHWDVLDIFFHLLPLHKMHAGLCGLNSVSCTVNSESCGINTPD